MQLARLLSAATCSLLGSAAQAAESKWDIDSAILFYKESGGRVAVVEPVISAKKDLGDDEILSMKLVLDSLTGASANGATPSTQVQTFIRPSGNGTYQTPANETPLDDSFLDTRVSFSLNWDKPIDRNNRRNLGFNVSKEYDFLSLSGNALWQHDINQKNTTITSGINFEFDQIDADGGAPVGLSNMLDQNKTSGTESREIIDLLFGVTQVIDKTSLFQINLSLSQANGYLTDPYKLLSVVDDVTGEPDHYLFEHRPDSRFRRSLYGKYRKQLANRDIFTASYRYMTDDWEVDSHTFDFTYRFKISNGYFIQPHLRFYQQTSTYFYRYFLLDSEAVPGFASADYRLGDLRTTTVGVKFGKATDSKHVWSARLAYYLQSGESSPSEAVGQLTQQDLFPDVHAVIVQFNYSFRW